MSRHAVGVLGLVTVLFACSSEPGDPESSRTPTADPPGVTARTATELRAVAGCQGEGPNNHVADLTWQPARPAGDGQRLVLSYLPGGLDTDAFVQSPVLPADQADYHWIHLNPDTGVRHWRVLTRHGDEWVASDTATFDGVVCD